MRNISFLVVIYTIMSCVFNSGCQRSAEQIWEDTKTGGSYIGKGIRSTAGKHGKSSSAMLSEGFTGPSQGEYIPLNDDDIYQKLAIGDASTLNKINAYSSIPQSKEKPGDLGSSIPGIDKFKDPEIYRASSIFKHIHFDTNDYVVKGQENREIIKKISNYLKKHPNLYIFVEGHCDERGTAAYNLSLGSKRGNSIRALLVKEGVNFNKIFTISYGKERPINLGHEPSALAQNRRGQFKLYEKNA